MNDMKINENAQISDMELFHRMKKFMQLTRMEMGRRRGFCGGPHGPQGGPPMGPGPHCPHGRHGHKRPLSREHLLVMIGSEPAGVRQKTLAENADAIEVTAPPRRWVTLKIRF